EELCTSWMCFSFFSQDILSFIGVRGPITEGIFSIPGKIRPFLSLKERLDSGTEVNLNNESVPVVASILKEFLRNIPGSVLTSRLYDEWLGVLDQVYEEKKVAAVQSLLEQLPQLNAILLKQLFRILYKIERNSEVNHMTSSNLAICIALCILCLPSSCNSRLADITKKKAYNSLDTPTDIVETEEKEQEDNLCPSGRTRPTGNDAVPISPTALLHSEGIIDSEEHVKMSLIHLMITWGSDISQDNVCLIPPAPNEEHPTGNSDNPLAPNKELDMLSIIEEKGLHTEKTFRTMSNKSFRTLKEKLDNGEEVNLTEESVLVVASVLKEFVRHIQGSLLCSDLYEKWLEVPDKGFLNQNIAAIQSLLSQIPKPNFILLRHLMSVLYKIKSHSSINHMDAYGLSVRIAPNLLWRPTSYSSGFGDDLSKKVRVLKETKH
uniref:Rho-GAP domain-containing protein n=1 Tax=Peromyscus maniculatus bairdii TaxID=230844 RepID=A0A8C8W8M2_PERMB